MFYKRKLMNKKYLQLIEIKILFINDKVNIYKFKYVLLTN